MSEENQAFSETSFGIELQVGLEWSDIFYPISIQSFNKEIISLGRAPINDISLPLTSVSRCHAQIFYEGSDFYIEDLSSRHGVIHNHQRLLAEEKRRLQPGDNIEILAFRLKVSTYKAHGSKRSASEALARQMIQQFMATSELEADRCMLQVENGPDSGARFILADGGLAVVIGCEPQCDFVLKGEGVASWHCLLKRTQHGFSVQDLGSNVGVWVNGQRLEPNSVQSDCRRKNAQLPQETGDDHAAETLVRVAWSGQGRDELVQKRVNSSDMQEAEAEPGRLLADGDELLVGSIKLRYIDPLSRVIARLEAQASVGAASSSEHRSPSLEQPEGDESDERDEQDPDKKPMTHLSSSMEIEPQSFFLNRDNSAVEMAILTVGGIFLLLLLIGGGFVLL